MNKSYTISFLVLIVSLVTLACSGSVLGLSTERGSGEVAEETRSLGSFSGVSLTNFGDLYIELGNKEEIRIVAEDNLIEYFETEIEGNILKIKTRDNTNIVSTEPVKFYLTVKEIESIRNTGSGDIFTPDFEINKFELSVTGSGNVKMEDLESNTLKVDVTGSGDVSMGDLMIEECDGTLTGSGKLTIDSLEGETVDVTVTGSGDMAVGSGSVESQNILLNGSGKYEADHLESQRVTVKITGSGSASVDVREALDATLTGSGDLLYRGKPSMDVNASGSGDVKSLE
jgi:hypothetical protein